MNRQVSSAHFQRGSSWEHERAKESVIETEWASSDSVHGGADAVWCKGMCR